MAESQVPKATREREILQTLIKATTEGQRLQFGRQIDTLQSLIEARAKCQGLQAIWEAHRRQGLVKVMSKGQALKSFRQRLETLIEVVSKRQGP